MRQGKRAGKRTISLKTHSTSIRISTRFRALKSNLAIGLEAIHSLFFFGAAGLVALGGYINSVVGVSTSLYPILWAAGGLFVYNLDRLIPDAADRINLPERSEFHRTRKVLIAISLLALLVLPVLVSSWKTLAWILLGVTISPFYCLAPQGFTQRIKDFPLLKCLAPPLVILVTLTTPIWIEPETRSLVFSHGPFLVAVLLALLVNILLFDLRDRIGDQSTGLKTVANRLQPRSFFILLNVLLLTQISLSISEKRIEMIGLGLYLSTLVWLSRKLRKPAFYHWAVDGMLFVPGIVAAIFN